MSLPENSGSAPRVSVVVPFYESERYLAACIECATRSASSGARRLRSAAGRQRLSGRLGVRSRRATRKSAVLTEPKPGAYAAQKQRRSDSARAPVIALTDADCVAAAGLARRRSSRACATRETAVLVGDVALSRGRVGFAAPAGGLRERESTLRARAAALRRIASPTPTTWRCGAPYSAELGPFEEWKRAGDTELVHRLARERPELRVAYRPSMRVTHHEFTSWRARARRMRLYQGTRRIRASRASGSWASGRRSGHPVATAPALLQRSRQRRDDVEVAPEMQDRDESRTLIVGAGPAGLACAWELGRRGRAAEVFEQDQLVGGISRTVSHKGYRFDIGGHRFFTKVPLVWEMWREILDDEFLERPAAVAHLLPGKVLRLPAQAAECADQPRPVRGGARRAELALVAGVPRARGAQLRAVGGQPLRPPALRDLLQDLHREGVGHARAPRSVPTGRPSASRTWIC